MYKESFDTGKRRTMMGTDWPVENWVEKVRDGRWDVIFGLCNGDWHYRKTYRTKWEAVEAATKGIQNTVTGEYMYAAEKLED